MEVCIQDEVEPEGPLVSGQGATVVPIGVKEEGAAGSFSDADDLWPGSTGDVITTGTGTEPAKKRKSVVSSSSGSEEGSSAISSHGSPKGSTKRTGKNARRRRRKRGLGDTQFSSAPAGLLVDKNNNNADHHGGDDDVSPSRGATALDQSDSAPVPTVCEVAEDHNHTSSSSSSSSSSTSLGRRNSAPEVAKQETKRLSIPLLGRRLRLDIKFGHEIVHKEPRADVEHHLPRSKGEEAEKKVNDTAPAAVEKESQVQAKQHDTSEGAHHQQHHNHHNPFHFLSNLFHHQHHHHHHHQHGQASNEHPAVPQTHSVAPKVEVTA